MLSPRCCRNSRQTCRRNRRQPDFYGDRLKAPPAAFPRQGASPVFLLCVQSVTDWDTSRDALKVWRILDACFQTLRILLFRTVSLDLTDEGQFVVSRID